MIVTRWRRGGGGGRGEGGEAEGSAGEGLHDGPDHHRLKFNPQSLTSPDDLLTQRHGRRALLSTRSRGILLDMNED